MARRRRRSSDDDASGGVALGLLVLGSVLYTKFTALDPRWRVPVAVLGIGAVVLITWALMRLARSRRRERLIHREVRSLTWREFEAYVQVLLQELGWKQVRHVGGSGDGGVDLRGTYNGERWIVQCKHYSSQVQPTHVRDLIGRLADEVQRGRADRALFVTSSSFGPQSRQLERRHPIELWDGRDLARRRLEANGAALRRQA